MISFFAHEVRKLALLVLLFTIGAGAALCQSSIVGTATDLAGGVVPAAAVNVTNESTSQTAAAGSARSSAAPRIGHSR